MRTLCGISFVALVCREDKMVLEFCLIPRLIAIMELSWVQATTNSYVCVLRGTVYTNVCVLHRVGAMSVVRIIIERCCVVGES